MKYIIEPPYNKIECDVHLPASKSISNRALILNALSLSPGTIKNIAICDDTNAMIGALKGDCDVNIGAAGTAMRFLTAYFAMQDGKITKIDGSERMRHRPIKILVEALRACGANIEYMEADGYPPLLIKGGKLHGGEIKLQGNVSSQYISALMMISPHMTGGLEIKLEGEIISRPYIDMTISLMREYGVNAYMDESIIYIPQGRYKADGFSVESDWSAASYWYQMQALIPQSEIFLKGLLSDSVQGDSRVAEYFGKLGVSTYYTKDGVRLSTTLSNSDILELDLVDQPDLAQTIVVTACLMGRKFIIKGLSTLKIKETDRIEALRTQLFKLGYEIEVGADYSLSWDGIKRDSAKTVVIDTFDDHRMAMAFAPAAILYHGIEINDPQVVSKSYPDYWKHLKSAGFSIKEA